MIEHSKLTPAQKRAVDTIRKAGGYVPLTGHGPDKRCEWCGERIDPRTINKLWEHGIIEMVEDEHELRIEGLRFTPEANIRYLRRYRG